MNGAPLRVDEVAPYQTIIDLASGTLDKEGLAAWLRQVAPARDAE